jgi:biotin carboxyl carrier protein
LIVEIEVNGRRRRVEVRREGEQWMVTVDGRTKAVTVSEIVGRWSVLLGSPDDARTFRSYEVSFNTRGGESLVQVNGQSIPLSVVDPRAASRRRVRGTGGASASPAGGTAAADGPRSVVAPMPGRIVKVLVKAGDRVAARQGVVVVEAMKMENELRAPRAGTVGEVRVVEGMSVEANAVLVVVE